MNRPTESSIKSIIGIDPGQTKSAACVLNGKSVTEAIYLENEELAEWLSVRRARNRSVGFQLAIEATEPRAQILGRALHDTIRVAGVLVGIWRPRPLVSLTSRIVRQALTGNGQAKDGQVRQVLRDIWGGGTQRKKGDPLYIVRGHVWDALAVAVVAAGRYG